MAPFIVRWIFEVELWVCNGPLGEDEGFSAERAGGVAEEPGVDAVDVEGVAAGGEQPELILVGELAEADGAVEWLLGGADDLLVEEDWKGVDQGLVQAGVVEVEELLELPLEGVRSWEFSRV